jgi:transposase InsO family protein
MKVFSIAKGFHRLWKNTPPELTQKERDKLRVLRLWQETGDVSLVCKTFDISRATIYRWRKNYDPKDPASIKEKRRTPKTFRKPAWTHELVIAVRDLRRTYPRWGKEKIAAIVMARGWKTSESTVGRILGYLKRRGEIIDPYAKSISSKKRTSQRPHAVRKPKDYEATEPGDIVQVDTLDIRPVPGTVLKQFTARDTVSRWDVLEARSRATAKTAKDFLDTVMKRMPFPVKAVQVDGGSEFYAEFEEACKQKDIKLFVLPPRSPKLNGCVERANRTHTEEFYEVNDCPWTVPELNRKLRQWEYVYNCIRPHHSLVKKTPLQFLKDCGIINDINLSGLSHMY